MEEKKEVKETGHFIAGKSKPPLLWGYRVTVKASEEPGFVTGIAYDEIEGEPLRWTYRVNDGWYTLNQLIPFPNDKK